MVQVTILELDMLHHQVNYTSFHTLHTAILIPVLIMATTGKSLPKKTIPPLILTKAIKTSTGDTSLSDSDSDIWQTVESNNKRIRSPNEISPVSKKN